MKSVRYAMIGGSMEVELPRDVSNLVVESNHRALDTVRGYSALRRHSACSSALQAPPSSTRPGSFIGGLSYNAFGKCLRRVIQ